MKTVTFAIASLFDAWIAMLLLDAANEADPRVPALGYWVTFALVVALGSVVMSAAHIASSDGK